MAVGQLVNDVKKMARDEGDDFEKERGSGLEGEDEVQEDEVIERQTGGRITRYHGACDIPPRASRMYRISNCVFLPPWLGIYWYPEQQRDGVLQYESPQPAPVVLPRDLGHLKTKNSQVRNERTTLVAKTALMHLFMLWEICYLEQILEGSSL